MTRMNMLILFVFLAIIKKELIMKAFFVSSFENTDQMDKFPSKYNVR